MLLKTRADSVIRLITKQKTGLLYAWFKRVLDKSVYDANLHLHTSGVAEALQEI